MYFYGEPPRNTHGEQEHQEKHQEEHQENYEYGASGTASDSKSMPKWVLPVVAVSVVALIGVWFLMKKKKPSGQKFGFKFY